MQVSLCYSMIPSMTPLCLHTQEYLSQQNGVEVLSRLHTFQCDIVSDDLPLHLRCQAVDMVLMTFMLSAVEPRHHISIFKKARQALVNQGGLLFFRDYGLYDATQLRAKKRLQDSLFIRADGTLAYFFEIEEVRRMLEETGFEVIECNYATVQLTNRSTKEVMRRVFLHAKARCK